LWVLLLVGLPLAGQQLEPQAYAVSPVGVNAVVFAYSTMDGDVSFDPTLPIENAKTVLNRFDLGYFRSIDFFGRTASITALIPYTEGDTEGVVSGSFEQIRRSGLRDPAVRFAVNLLGAPAMRLPQFANYRQKWIIGASFVVAAPLGQYDPARLINTGTNRWSFKPEIGVSRTIRRWTLELIAGVWLFTDNKNFVGTKRSQDPIGASQIHVVYTFRPRFWASFNANFYTGGRTTVGGVLRADLQRNSRIGGMVSIPIAKRHSIKAGYSAGAYTTIGADHRSISVSYQFLWGGGL
jgi:hypothetical protein